MEETKEVLEMWVGKMKVLSAFCYERIKKQRITRYPNSKSRRTRRFSTGNIDLTKQKVYHSSNRNTTKFISYKDIKTLMADLKRVYIAVDEQTAILEHNNFDKK